MSTQTLDALSRLAARRFGSFADAAMSVLDLLESASPGGSLVLGQVDWDEGKCRVIDARGDARPARRGDPPRPRACPPTAPPPVSCSTRSRWPRSSPANWVAAPLDAADGRVVGVLLATGASGEAASRDVAQLLAGGRPAPVVRVGEHLRPRRAAPARRGGARPREHRPDHRPAEPRDAGRLDRARARAEQARDRRVVS